MLPETKQSRQLFLSFLSLSLPPLRIAPPLSDCSMTQYLLREHYQCVLCGACVNCGVHRRIAAKLWSLLLISCGLYFLLVSCGLKFGCAGLRIPASMIFACFAGFKSRRKKGHKRFYGNSIIWFVVCLLVKTLNCTYYDSKIMHFEIKFDLRIK